MIDKHNQYVGYGCPPKHTRFKKGQSGNQKRHTKKKDDIYTLLLRVLNRKIRLKDEDRQMPIREALIRKLRSLALSGDRRAIDLQRRILDEAWDNQPDDFDPEAIRMHVLDAFRKMGVKVTYKGDDDV